jgi:putative copper resistance protein D
VRPTLRRPAHRLALVSAILLLLGAVVWLMATAATMGDGPADAINPQVIGLVLGRTSFGRVWGPHIFVCALAMLATLGRSAWGWWPTLVLSTVALGALGLVGHAAIDTGLHGILNRTSQVLHLLSSGFWLGALLPLLFLLPLFRDKSLETGADLALRRFSGLGHFAVALLLLTGVANSWFILGTTLDPASPYQQLLLVKIAIAGSMCVLAIVNRYVFMPRIPSGGPGARQLGHGTIAEIVLGAAILVLVSIIGMISPA